MALIEKIQKIQSTMKY